MYMPRRAASSSAVAPRWCSSTSSAPVTTAIGSVTAASPALAAKAPPELLVEAGVDPVHLRAQLLADHLDLVPGLLVAHPLEVLLTGAVLRDPFAREVARLDIRKDLLHRLAGRFADDAPAARHVAVLG